MQLAIASAVLADLAAPMEQRAHAKCWALYRSMEGADLGADECRMITAHVSLCEIGNESERVRWETSLRTANFYWRMLKLKEAVATWDEESPVTEWLRVHPSFAVNYMRVNAVLAYRALLLGHEEECRSCVLDALRTGLRTCAWLHPDQHVLRLLEMRDDWHAYVTLALIGQRQGCIPMVHAPWATAEMIERDDGHLPYVKCLKQLGAGGMAERRIW